MNDGIRRWFGSGSLLLLLSFFISPAAPAQVRTPTYTYIRAGKSEPAHSKYEFGIAMMGGGSDLDEAFRWLCAKAPGGDLLVLRARGDDEYNPYIDGLCKMNSVATLIIPDREAAQDPSCGNHSQRASGFHRWRRPVALHQFLARHSGARRYQRGYF